MLTPAELATMDVYYRTETGRRTIRTMYTAGDHAAVIKEVVANPEGEISAKARASVSASARRKFAAETGPADQAAAEALMQGISLAKLHMVGQAVQKLTHELVNEPDPAFDARMAEATGKAFDKYIAQQDAKR